MTAVNEAKVKVNDSWVSLVPDATISNKGIVQIGSGLSVTDGIISVSGGSGSAYPLVGMAYITDQGYGKLITSNVYVGTIGKIPFGVVSVENGESTNGRSGEVYFVLSNSSSNNQSYTVSIIATNAITGATRTANAASGYVTYKGSTSGNINFEIGLLEITSISLSASSSSVTMSRQSYTSMPVDVYIGAP